jgi:hypothetical protein
MLVVAARHARRAAECQPSEDAPPGAGKDAAMSAVSDILKQVPIADLATQLGVSKTEAKAASTEVIKSLLGGLASNAQDSKGEQSLASALAQHAEDIDGIHEGKGLVDVSKVDTDDGKKIVQHALGSSTTEAATALADLTGQDSSLLKKLLPILAPIVLAYLGAKLTKTTTSSGTSILGSILGGVLGSSTATSTSTTKTTTSSSDDGLDLGGILGGVLGGALGSSTSSSSSSSSSGSILGSILGNLL